MTFCSKSSRYPAQTVSFLALVFVPLESDNTAGPIVVNIISPPTLIDSADFLLLSFLSPSQRPPKEMVRLSVASASAAITMGSAAAFVAPGAGWARSVATTGKSSELLGGASTHGNGCPCSACSQSRHGSACKCSSCSRVSHSVS